MKTPESRDLMSHNKTIPLGLKILFLLVCLCYTRPATAQHFTYKSRLTSVSKDGFYKIPLSPELSARSQDYWRDIRLMDDQGKEIPYLLRQQVASLSNAPFVPYTIVRQERGDSLQYIVVANPERARIDHILLELANADAARTLSISGSNDQSAWYAVRDACSFNPMSGEQTAPVYRDVSFPLTEYAFYKITIHNGRQQPLNIVRAGYLEQQQTIQATYCRVPGISFTRKDSSDKHSYIRIRCSPANIIDKLVFHISAPAQYHRDAYISATAPAATDNAVSSKSLYSRRLAPENHVALSSDQEPQINVEAYAGDAKCAGLDIQISNLDNQPLQIDSITAYQAAVFLVAQLQQGKIYDLYCGDSALSLPEYDIVYFENKIPEHISSVAAGPVVPLENTTAPELTKSWDNSRYLVWAGLGVAGIAIGFMTFRMLRDMNKDR